MEAGIPGPRRNLKGWDKGLNASVYVTGKGRGLAAHYGLEEEDWQSLRPRLERTSTTGQEHLGRAGRGRHPDAEHKMRSFGKLAWDCSEHPHPELAPVPTQEHPAHLDAWPAGYLTCSGHRGIHEGPSGVGLHLLHLVFQQVHQDGDDIILPHLFLAL